MQPSFLSQLQLAIDKKLNSLPDLHSIPVISHKNTAISQWLDELSLAGAPISIFVLNPLPTKIIPTSNSLSFEESLIRIQIIESPLSNSHASHLLNLAEIIALSLHNFQPSLPNWSGHLSLNPSSPWKEIPDPSKSGKYILELSFTASGASSSINL